MKKVLITGITGKSGMYLLENILSDKNCQRDYHFGFVVRNKEKIEAKTKCIENCSIYVGDLEDKAFLSSVFSDGYSILLHIAGIQKSLNLVKTAIEVGHVRWMIMVHTTGIFSKYKAAGEGYRKIEKEIYELIRMKNIDLTILRPTMIYGNMNDKNISVFIKMVDKFRCFPVVNGAKYELQPVWCGDLGKAYYQVLLNSHITKNKNYNLSGGEPIMLIDIFRTIAKYLNVNNRFISFPFWLSYSLAVVLYFFTLTKIDYREKVQRLVEPRVFSHEEAKRDFGYNPLSFPIGTKKEIEEYLIEKKK